MKISTEQLIREGCLNPEEYINTRATNLQYACTVCSDTYITSRTVHLQPKTLHMCKKCATKSRLIKQRLPKEQLVASGCLNPEVYEKNTTLLAFKCTNCDNTYTTTWNQFREHTKLCAACSLHQLKTPRKTTIDKVLASGVINIEDFIDTNKVNLNYICADCGEVYTTSYHSYLRQPNKVCKRCVKKYIKSKKATSVAELNEIKCLNPEMYVEANTHNLLFKCTNCSNTFTTTYSDFPKHSKLCKKCSSNFSALEEEIAGYIKSIYLKDIQYNVQYLSGVTEVDIYLPEVNFAIEVNGVYWHSEKYRKDRSFHKTKTDSCTALGITLWHIWEDDWQHKKPLIKAMLRSRIVKDNTRVYARKCTIRSVPSVTAFLTENHLQGSVGASVKYGLYYEDTLLSVMTFMKGSKGYTLNRFCTKQGYTVVGGASKLLNYFRSRHPDVTVYSFSDNTYSNGKLYTTLGFDMLSVIPPDYKYLYRGKLTHKFNFRHTALKRKFANYDSTLSEYVNCTRNKVYRVYDSGKTKWQLPPK